MAHTDWGWQAHISDDFDAVARDGRRVYLHRRLGDTVEVITGFTKAGDPHIDRSRERDPAVTMFRGLLIPGDALVALAETVQPGPGAREVGRLEEALTVERMRNDRVVEQLLDYAAPTRRWRPT